MALSGNLSRSPDKKVDEITSKGAVFEMHSPIGVCSKMHIDRWAI